MMVLGLFFPVASFEGATSGLTLFLTVLVPYLLPFLTFSKLFMHTVTRKTTSPSAFWMYCLASVGGYPNGALLVKQAYEQGRLKSPAWLLAALQFPSPMFLIAFVGIASLNDRMIGITLYLLLHGINLSIFILWLLRKSSTLEPAVSLPRRPAQSFFLSISETLTIIAVSVIVSSSLAEVLVQTFVLPDSFAAILYGVLELSAGIEQFADLNVPLFYYGLLIGFTGMSIHLQNYLLLRGLGISFAPYWATRLLTMLVLGLILYCLA
ncbi:hypothetical protein MKY84_10330 [Chryseomicrobium sp. FSL W7-1435]|uniref:hypothetical protein n=1 Tax=Chryseomicrobium sp. FSL W7-1435 TaxID=2921704 RepID=UPI00315ADCA4